MPHPGFPRDHEGLSPGQAALSIRGHSRTLLRVNRFVGYPGVRHQTLLCLATTSGCSTTGWSNSISLMGTAGGSTPTRPKKLRLPSSVPRRSRRCGSAESLTRSTASDRADRFMSSSPLSSAQAARAAVAARLQDIMKDAGLTGLEVAARCGWHKSKSSRIARGKTPPSDADIRAWCAACGASDQVADPIAASRSAESMYVEWRQIHRDGMRRVHEQTVPLSTDSLFPRLRLESCPWHAPDRRVHNRSAALHH